MLELALSQSPFNAAHAAAIRQLQRLRMSLGVGERINLQSRYCSIERTASPHGQAIQILGRRQFTSVVCSLSSNIFPPAKRIRLRNITAAAVATSETPNSGRMTPSSGLP